MRTPGTSPPRVLSARVMPKSCKIVASTPSERQVQVPVGNNSMDLNSHSCLGWQSEAAASLVLFYGPFGAEKKTHITWTQNLLDWCYGASSCEHIWSSTLAQNHPPCLPFAFKAKFRGQYRPKQLPPQNHSHVCAHRQEHHIFGCKAGFQSIPDQTFFRKWRLAFIDFTKGARDSARVRLEGAVFW